MRSGYYVAAWIGVIVMGWLVPARAWQPSDQWCPYLDGTARPYYQATMGYTLDAKTENSSPKYAQLDIQTAADLLYFHDIAYGDLDLRLQFDNVFPLGNAVFQPPDHLMVLALEARWVWRYVNHTAFALTLDPGFYASTEDVLDMPLSMPITAAGIYTLHARLAMVAGLQIRPGFYHLLLPYGGVVWQPHEQLRVEGTFPEARVTLHVDRDWSGVAGWNWQSTSYHIEPEWAGRDRLTLASQELYLEVRRHLSDELHLSGSLGWAMDRSAYLTRSRDHDRGHFEIDDALVVRVGVTGAW